MQQQNEKDKSLLIILKTSFSKLRHHLNSKNEQNSNLRSSLDNQKTGDTVELWNQWLKACINLYRQIVSTVKTIILTGLEKAKQLTQLISVKRFIFTNTSFNGENLISKKTFFSKKALIIYFQFWTLALLFTTLNLQHSCTPMIAWSDDMSVTCAEVTNKTTISSKPSIPQKSLNASKSHNSVKPIASDNKPTTAQKVVHPSAIDKSPKSSSSNSYPEADIIGLGAGATTALVVGGITTAPVTIAVGAGVFVWWLMKSWLSN